MKTLDTITIGRSSVDLYGAQIGGRLEDMASFQKYIGGSPMAAYTLRADAVSAWPASTTCRHFSRCAPWMK